MSAFKEVCCQWVFRVSKLHPLCAYVCLFVCFMEQYPTEEDMIEWAKRESEREEKERLARLTQQEQEDLELAIALSKSELSWGGPSPLHWSGLAQPDPAQKAPKQSGDCTGLIQQHLLTPWRDTKLIWLVQPPLSSMTAHPCWPSWFWLDERNGMECLFVFLFFLNNGCLSENCSIVNIMFCSFPKQAANAALAPRNVIYLNTYLKLVQF